jgi:hypothetical protein
MPELVSAPYPLTKPNFEEFNSLNRFFEEVEGFFINIVFHWDQVLLPKKYRDRIQQVWPEIGRTLRNIISGNLTATQNFNDAGLESGSNQLTLKLEVLSDIWKKFNENGSPRLLKGVLRVINLILGSISTEMKMAEKIKEFGEFLENLISGDFGGLDTFLRTL